mmetsp:Transcript_41338/g.133224  ORF Transcript_41338/g.133224 Transcript_41338/m.133224 type:complete len:202 (+) Transcript_41338:691-1296(+)
MKGLKSKLTRLPHPPLWFNSLRGGRSCIGRSTVCFALRLRLRAHCVCGHRRAGCTFALAPGFRPSRRRRRLLRRQLLGPRPRLWPSRGRRGAPDAARGRGHGGGDGAGDGGGNGAGDGAGDRRRVAVLVPAPARRRPRGAPRAASNEGRLFRVVGGAGPRTFGSASKTLSAVRPRRSSLARRGPRLLRKPHGVAGARPRGG